MNRYKGSVHIKNIKIAMLLVAMYGATYFFCRVLYTNPSESDYTWKQWLFGETRGQLDYLFGWLVHNHSFSKLILLSILPALFGKYRFGFCLWFGNTAGLLLGEFLGNNPAGGPWGQDHYGWFLWFGYLLVSAIAGIMMERLYKKHETYKHKSFLICITAALVVYVWITLYVMLSVMNYQSPSF